MDKKRQSENLYSFSKLYGYTRYFYPGDEASALNWDEFLVYGIEQVKNCSDKKELLSKLNKLFQPVAPLLSFAKSEYVPDGLNRKNLINVYFVHKGFGLEKNPIYRSYRIGRDKIPKKIYFDISKPETSFVIKNIGNNIICTIPIILKLPLKKPDSFSPEFESLRNTLKNIIVDYETADDEHTRIASIIYSWNIFKHSYPYFDIVKVDWDEVLKRTLKESLALNKNTQDCFLTLRIMVEKLKDGHGWVSHKNISANFYLPLIFDWVENKIIVKKSFMPGIKPGDLVLEINGKNAYKLFNRVSGLKSGTRQTKIANGLYGIRTSEYQKAELKIIRDKKIRFFTVDCVGEDDNFKMYKSIGNGFKKIKKNIYYILPAKMTRKEVLSNLSKMAKAKGLIIDMRAYPKVNVHSLLSHMIKNQITSQRWNTPIIKFPDYENVNEFDTSGRWRIKPKEPFIKAKTIFLINGKAMSYMESVMGIVEHYKLGIIIGTQTAGTNGDINPFSTPGGFNFVFTGMKVLKHDGSQHHLIGIKPDIKIEPTIKGIREGRDELLEKAIEIIGD